MGGNVWNGMAGWLLIHTCLCPLCLESRTRCVAGTFIAYSRAARDRGRQEGSEHGGQGHRGEVPGMYLFIFVLGQCPVIVLRRLHVRK